MLGAARAAAERPGDAAGGTGMIRVGISGATGLVGESLIRALSGHPRAHLTRLASAHAAGREITEILPALAKELSHRTVPP